MHESDGPRLCTISCNERVCVVQEDVVSARGFTGTRSLVGVRQGMLQAQQRLGIVLLQPNNTKIYKKNSHHFNSPLGYLSTI